MDAKESTTQWAGFYRARGFNPLPSRVDAKRPLCRFAQWWDTPAPADLFERFPTTNIQLMTGRRWRLLVIDLDGKAAAEHFASLGAVPRTWITHSGGGGWHLWFRLWTDHPAPLSKAILWRGEGEHSAIERLCDRSLVMAPPSIHPTTGQRYRFLDADHSPKKLPMPTDCPGWVLGLRPLVKSLAERVQPVIVAPKVAAPSSRHFDRSEVLAAIHDKIGLARSWGVRIAGRPNQSGWCPCHAIDRPDVHPSAAIHCESGSYVDHGSGVKLSLFDLSVHLGVYGSFHESIQQLGDQQHARYS